MLDSGLQIRLRIHMSTKTDLHKTETVHIELLSAATARGYRLFPKRAVLALMEQKHLPEGNGSNRQ